MVITTLEAHVDLEKASVLLDVYQKGIQEGLPPQMTQTFLLQSAADKTLWQIISVWKSREALEEMRNSGDTPAGVLMFRAAGAEPKLSIFGVPVAAP